MARSRMKQKLLACLAVFGALALSIFLAASVLRSLNSSPFHLLLQPKSGQFEVQFIQPDAKLVSRRVTVTLPHEELHERYDLVLDSASVPIPGGRVVYADTTVRPGRFKIRIGDANFDAMEREIYVNGSPSGWEACPGAVKRDVNPPVTVGGG